MRGRKTSFQHVSTLGRDEESPATPLCNSPEETRSTGAGRSPGQSFAESHVTNAIHIGIGIFGKVSVGLCDAGRCQQRGCQRCRQRYHFRLRQWQRSLAERKGVFVESACVPCLHVGFTIHDTCNILTNSNIGLKGSYGLSACFSMYFKSLMKSH